MVDRRDEPERDRRISIPNIPAEAVRWYLSVFNTITVYRTVTNTLFILVTQQITGWQAVQYVVVGEMLKAGGVALITSPVITEANRMVIGAIWTKRKVQEARAEGREEGREEGRAEGRREYHDQWETWFRRFRDAEAKGMPFDEPPPPPPEPESP